MVLQSVCFRMKLLDLTECVSSSPGWRTQISLQRWPNHALSQWTRGNVTSHVIHFVLTHRISTDLITTKYPPLLFLYFLVTPVGWLILFRFSLFFKNCLTVSFMYVINFSHLVIHPPHLPTETILPNQSPCTHRPACKQTLNLWPLSCLWLPGCFGTRSGSLSFLE